MGQIRIIRYRKKKLNCIYIWEKLKVKEKKIKNESKFNSTINADTAVINGPHTHTQVKLLHLLAYYTDLMPSNMFGGTKTL